MPRKREKGYVDLVLEREALVEKLTQVEETLNVMQWQRTRSPGDKITVRMGKAEYPAAVGQRREVEGDTEYFVYIERVDGFGADGHRIKSSQVIYEVQETAV